MPDNEIISNMTIVNTRFISNNCKHCKYRNIYLYRKRNSHAFMMS